MTLDSSFYRSSFSQLLRDEGRVEGRAEGLLESRIEVLQRILSRRGIRTTGEQRALYRNCKDVDVLDVWIDSAATATTADEVFDAS